MKTKILLAVFFSALSFQAFSTTEEDVVIPAEGSVKTISKERYIRGGVASMLLGFGIGHAIQGRYSERGWIFTAGGAIFIVSTIGFVSSFRGRSSNTFKTNSFSDYAFLGLMFVSIGGRVWELIDAWMLDYKIVKKSPFEIKPLAFYDPYKKLNYGLSLKYSF